jgi:hypothetical protein
MFASFHSRNSYVRPARRGVLATVGVVTATAVLGVAPSASAQTAQFCPTIERLSATGATKVTINPTDSVATAVAKVDRVRNAFVLIKRTAGPDIQPELGRIVTNLGTTRKLFAGLRTARGAKANAIRRQIEEKALLVQADVGFIELSYIENCEGSVDLGGGNGGASDPQPIEPVSPLPAPAPAPSASTGGATLNGSGVYEIGVDVQPGPYTTRGSVACQAGQSNDPTGTDISQGLVVPIGTGVTTIMLDGANRYFITRDCPGWRAGVKP